MSDDLPTAPLPQPGTGQSEPRERRFTRTALIALSVLALLLIIGLTIALTLLLSGRGDTPPTEPSTSPSAEPSPSASLEPSEQPNAEPSADATTEPSDEPSETSAPPPPPPPATGPVFTSFAPANNTSVGCSGDSGQVAVTFTWASTGADEAAIGVATSDAFAGPYETGLPPSGSYELNYQCSNATQIYTVSIRGTSGQTNKTVTLKR